MSAPADPSAVSGDNITSGDGSRLEQPSDAVPMKSMSQLQEDGDGKSSPHPADNNDDNKAKTQAATEGSSSHSGDSPNNAEETEDAGLASPSKGKEKEMAPQPPAVERQDSMAIGPAQDEIVAPRRTFEVDRLR